MYYDSHRAWRALRVAAATCALCFVSATLIADARAQCSFDWKQADGLPGINGY